MKKGGARVAVLEPEDVPCADGDAAAAGTPTQAVSSDVVAWDAAPALASTQRARFDALRERLDGYRARHQKQRAKRPAREPLPGAVEQTPLGRLHRYLEVRSPEDKHGHVELANCLRISAQALSELSLDLAMADVDIERLLFLDTETTGLAGGAGTLPFLIGVAWFENGALQVEQLLLLAPGEEAPMLSRLAERMARSSAIVTYNGKSFDWPLLRNRFVLNRVPLPEIIPHLDVLHCARRVFKHRGGSMRLTHLEASELGYTRVGDIDGALIPPTYFRFLRGGSPTLLTPILTHNRHDLAALVGLLAVLCERLASPLANTNQADVLALAQLSERAGVGDRALAFAQSIAGNNASAAHSVEAQMLCARLLRRQGDLTGAATALHAALEHPHETGHAHVHLALTKLYEHKLRDHERALSHAAYTRPAEGEVAHERRVQRLRARTAIERA